MYISIAEVLNKTLKTAVAEKYGTVVGLNWPNTIVGPITARIDALNESASWEDEEARQRDVAQLREDVLEHFPHTEPQPEPKAEPKAKAKAKAKAQKGA